MPVNEEVTEPEPDPRVERVLAIAQRSRGAIGATDRVPVRVIILFILSICCVTLAPIPANVIGVAAIVLLALDTSLHRR